MQTTKVNDEILNNQQGQTLVEFVLLLASIVIISFGMMKIINNSIADRWEVMANIILDDPNQKLEVK